MVILKINLTTPRGGATPLPRRAQPLLLLFRSNPTEGGKKNKPLMRINERSIFCGSELSSTI